jgi:SNF family Na+-dependent transporter
MADTPRKEAWGSRLGVILAVTGSAVGLGNFLRFPGLVAEYQGTFMVPYLIALLLLGLPVAWAEWAMGRYGGVRGFNSCPGIFRAITRRNGAAYLGVFGLIIPVGVYMYYIFVESWCLGYAWQYLAGGLDLGKDIAAYRDFFVHYIGAERDGALLGSGLNGPLFWLLACAALNLSLIYRGLSKGIERFCLYAMPALVLCALIILVRVLTLGTPDPSRPELNVLNGLGHMWNVSGSGHLLKGVKSLDVIVEESEILDYAQAAALGEAAADALQAGTGGGYAVVASADSDATLSLRPAEVQFSEDAKNPAAPFTASVALEATLLNKLDQKHVLRGAVFRADSKKSCLYPEEALRSAFTAALESAAAQIPKSRSFWRALANSDLWLKSASQIFFSLSIGLGVVLTYSSYLGRKDDVALSSTTAVAGNEFCEVCLGGLIAIPAAFVFLGPAGAGGSTYGLGFQTLPMVFEYMPFGRFFGFLFFFLLFLAAITSSLSMLQPAIAFLEEGLRLDRKGSVALLGFITVIGTGVVVWFSAGTKAINTLDFWVGTFCIYLLATAQVLVFGWVLGIPRGFAELDAGASLRIPRFVGFLLKYVSPAYLLAIFGLWCYQGLPGQLDLLRNDPVVLGTFAFILMLSGFFLLLIHLGLRRWNREAPLEGLEP